MPGLMARILNRRPGTPAPPTPPAAGDDDGPAVIVPAHGEGRLAPPPHVVAAGEQPTSGAPAVPTAPSAAGDTATLPALGARDGSEVSPGPDAAPDAGARDPADARRATLLNRSRLRRRLRYLRRVRDLGLRDLGGLVLDLDRFGRERPDLVQMKLHGLRSIDRELRALELAVGDAPDFDELREPGISSCASCGALHGSEARFCPSCGMPVDALAARAVELPASAPAGPVSAPAGPAAAPAGPAAAPAEPASAPPEPRPPAA